MRILCASPHKLETLLQRGEAHDLIWVARKLCFDDLIRRMERNTVGEGDGVKVGEGEGMTQRARCNFRRD